ncbi:MAG: hypothetical protein ABI995_01410 [Acidobacteriota bacterium]
MLKLIFLSCALGALKLSAATLFVEVDWQGTLIAESNWISLSAPSSTPGADVALVVAAGTPFTSLLFTSMGGIDVADPLAKILSFVANSIGQEGPVDVQGFMGALKASDSH